MTTYFRVDHVQFRITITDTYIRVHFNGTNEIKDVLRWPWPVGKTNGVNNNIREVYNDIRYRVHKLITDHLGNVTQDKALVISGFSWGCPLAFEFALDMLKNQPSLILFVELDDPPRWRSKYYTSNKNFYCNIYLKGNCIVHHLPFQWMGYRHPNGMKFLEHEIPSNYTRWNLKSWITDHFLKVPENIRFCL